MNTGSPPILNPEPSHTPRINAAALSLGILAVVASGTVLKVAKSVVAPLLIAWLLSYLLTPVVNFLVKKLRFPAPIAVLSVVILLLLAAWGSGIVIQQRLMAFAKAFPEYQTRLTDLLTYYGNLLDIPSSVIKDFNWSAQIAPLVLGASRFFISFISNAIIVLIFLVFMLLAKPYTNDKLRAALPNRAGSLIALTNTISRQISAYLGALFMISLATGLVIWGALVWLGVEFAFTWGLLAFLLNFIPTLGSIVASIPPILMALVQHAPELWPVILVALVILVIQQFFGNFLAPKIYGDRLNLSPVVILLFLIFWGWLWGITGALLAVPLAAAIQITLAHIPALAPLAVLMGSGKKYVAQKRLSPAPDAADSAA
ncbi:MAG: AI-2E family transporter [Verrucomicrobiota bacterium]|jgi:predicted PurR-regulated permease PerM|nr:AI-2E family transporter [Verrucomicrobiota bacterium]